MLPVGDIASVAEAVSRKMAAERIVQLRVNVPAEVLSPPSGAPAVSMLVALFVAALFWNIGTWWFGLPNSSSHCLIGALTGVAVGNALVRDRSMGNGDATSAKRRPSCKRKMFIAASGQQYTELHLCADNGMVRGNPAGGARDMAKQEAKRLLERVIADMRRAAAKGAKCGKPIGRWRTGH